MAYNAWYAIKTKQNETKNNQHVWSHSTIEDLKRGYNPFNCFNSQFIYKYQVTFPLGVLNWRLSSAGIVFLIVKVKVKLATEVEGNQKAPFSIATTPRCREERYSFSWIAPLNPWYVPYIAE